jgi:DNA-directed RNA polymerase sigma subunit (sigma70/sigma32)
MRKSEASKDMDERLEIYLLSLYRSNVPAIETIAENFGTSTYRVREIIKKIEHERSLQSKASSGKENGFETFSSETNKKQQTNLIPRTTTRKS